MFWKGQILFAFNLIWFLFGVTHGNIPSLSSESTTSSIMISWGDGWDNTITQSTTFNVTDASSSDYGQNNLDVSILTTSGSIVINQGISPGVQYEFLLRGDDSDTLGTITETAKPLPPTISSVDGVPDTPGDITITWSIDFGSTQTGFIIESVGEIPVTVNDGSATSETVTVDPGSQHTFTVKAQSTDGAVSDPSNEFQGSAYSNPVIGVGVNSDVTDKTTEVKVTWAHGSGEYQGYKIEYTPFGGSAMRDDVESNSATSHVVAGLIPGQTYTVYVITLSAYGDETRSGSARNITTKPSTPGVTITSTSDSITVAIDGGPGIRKKYVIAYTDGTIPASEDVTTTNQMASTELQPLTTGTQYTITVTAVSGSTNVESNGTTVQASTTPDAPSNVQVIPSTTTHVDITWVAPSDSFPGTYSVQYRSASGSDLETSACVSSPCTEDVSGVGPPGTQIFVFVYAELAGGEMSDAAEGTGYTIPKEPLSLIEQEKTSTRLVFHVAKEVNTNGYDIRVQLDPTSTPVISFNGNVHEVVFNALDPGVQYTISAVVVVGMNIESAPRVMTTYTKPPTPVNLIEENSTLDSLEVTWSEPTGTFTTYRLTISNSSITQSVEKDAPRQATFSGLTAGAAFTIRITTLLELTGGSSVESDVFSEDFRTNPYPASNLRIDGSVGTRELIVLWNTPSSGDFDHYIIEMGAESHMIGKNDDRRQRFSNLLPGSSYTISVTVFSGTKSSTKETKTFYTKPATAAFNEPSSDTDSITVTWNTPREGEFTGYKLTLAVESLVVGNEIEVLQGETRSHTWNSGIVPGTTYTITLIVYVATPDSSQDDLESSSVVENETTKPKPARNLAFSGKTTNFVEATWAEPSLGNVEGYHLTLKGFGESDTVLYESVGSSVLSKTRNDLTPGKQYIMTVVSYVNDDMNAEVQGDPLEERLTMIPSPPGAITVGTVQANLIPISWGEAPNVKDGYEIQWKKNGTSTWITAPRQTTTSLQIDDLTRSTIYNIRVATYSGNEISAHVTETQATKPTGTSLTVTEFGIDFIHVEWAQPGTTFDRYELQISPSNGDQTVVVNPADPLEHRFTNLSPGVLYNMSIDVVFERQRESNTRTQGTKPLPVEELSVSDIMTNSMRISWTKPANSAQSDFEIEVSRTSASGVDVSKTITATSQNQYDELIDGLTAGVQYVITVFSNSNSLRSDPESITKHAKPKHPDGFSGTETSTSSLTLSWTEAAESNPEGYRITYKGQEIDTQEKTVDETSTSYQVMNLIPGDRYTYKINAFSGDQLSGDQEQTYVQEPLAPSTATISARTDHSLTVGWNYDNQAYYVEQFMVELRIFGESTLHRTTPEMQRLSPSTTFNNLISGQQYTIQVFSETFGSKRSSTYAEVHAYVKPRISDVFTIETTPTTAIITYTDVTNGVVERYRFNINDPNSQVQTKDIAAERRLTFSNLSPGTLYLVTIVAESGVQTSDPLQKPTLTKPSPPDAVECSQEQTRITLIIIGPALADEAGVELLTGPTRTQTVSYDTSSQPQRATAEFANLVPFTSYDFTVTIIRSQNDLREDSVEVSKVCVTAPAAPGRVQEFTYVVDSLTPNSVQLTWKEPEAKNGDIIKYTVRYVGARQGKPDDISRDMPISPSGAASNQDNEDDPTFMYEIVDLRGGYNYTFTIFGTTNLTDGNSGDGIEEELLIYTPLWEPALKSQYDPPQERRSNVKHDTVVVRFGQPFSDVHGEVIAYSVIVSENNRLPSDMEEQSYAQASSGPYVAIYRCGDFYENGAACAYGSAAVSNSGNTRRKRQATSEVEVEIGTGRCDGEYCNEPLTPNTQYYVFLRGYTSPDTYADFSNAIAVKTAKAPDDTSVVIIVAVLAVIFFIVLVLGAIFAYCLYRKGLLPGFRNKNMYDSDEGKKHKKSSDKEPSEGGDNLGLIIGVVVGVVVLAVLVIVIVLVILRRRGGGAGSAHRDKDFLHLRQSRHSVHQSHPIKISDFGAHVAEMSKDSDFLFAEEYEDLKEVGKEQAWDNAIMPVNRVKNRFTNILPYDHSRVKLLPSEDEEGSDYINANWMPGFNSKREFICAQGPLPSTIDDFWRMVWEQNVRAIVMLTRCVEKGRDKCSHYWPIDSEPMYYGDVQVEIRNEVKNQEWVITECNLSKGETVRRISHFHYTAWPDFDVPSVPQSLIHFVRTVRSRLQGEGGPTVVHCSAGVGRSGTFIVLDRMLQHIAQSDATTIDIHSVVHEMRRFRCWMVQTESQYIFIHKCIVCVLEGRENENGDDGADNPAYEDTDEGIHIQS